MSLNFNLAKVADSESIKTEKEWPLTQSIIFEMLAVGLGELTEKTLVEFKIRSDLYRTLDKLPLLPLADLRRRLGLTSNVSNETRASWVARTVTKGWMHEQERDLKRDAEFMAEVDSQVQGG